MNKQFGDALIVEKIDGAVVLEKYLSGDALSRKRRGMARQIIEIVNKIGQQKLAHRNLGLDRFLIADDKIYFNDARGLRRGGFTTKDLLTFGHNARRFATITELLRGSRDLDPQIPPPRMNPLNEKMWKRFVRRTRSENNDFGMIRSGKWSGYFTKSSRFSKSWESGINFNRGDWERIWPELIERIEGRVPLKRDAPLEIIKRDRSGDVLSGRIVLCGKEIDIIVKRPRRKYWYRYLVDLFRPARAERMWIKAWTLIGRDLPCEWPMILMQRKILGFAVDAIIILRRVPGSSLDKIDLNAMEPSEREMMFRRAGRILRAIERGGLVHYDSKSTNWIIYGKSPVMIDVDGIRPMNLWLNAWGIRRLLRAMKQHPQYTPADSLALCQGYAPYSGIQHEKNAD